MCTKVFLSRIGKDKDVFGIKNIIAINAGCIDNIRNGNFNRFDFLHGVLIGGIVTLFGVERGHRPWKK